MSFTSLTNVLVLLLNGLFLLINWAILGHEIFAICTLGPSFWNDWCRVIPFVPFLIANVLYLLGLLIKSHKLLLPLTYFYTITMVLCFSLGVAVLYYSIVMSISKSLKGFGINNFIDSPGYGFLLTGALVGLSVWSYLNAWALYKLKGYVKAVANEKKDAFDLFDVTANHKDLLYDAA